MSMIDVTDLSFAYEGSPEMVFEHVSFRIDTDWKLGFTGRNGRGKTTFLKLLMGEYPYQGKIQSSVEFVYFPCEVQDPAKMTLEVLEETNPGMEEWELFRELAALDVDAQALYRPFETLSHGERTKALLAALFLGENRFLLIDEPTNHLDLEGREAAARYLRGKKGFILVSHDRKFLDGCVDHILSINRMDIEIQKGNFSSWYANKEARDRMEAGENDRLRAQMRRLEAASHQAGNWSDRVERSKKGAGSGGLKLDRGYVGHKAAKMMKRSKVLEERRQKAIQEKAGLLKNVEHTEELKLCPLTHHSRRLATLEDVSLCYGEHSIFEHVSFQVEQGERICLAGRNGCGKSSLLKMLLGEVKPGAGTIYTASGLKISYVPQDSSFLQGKLVELARQYGLEPSLFLALLRKLGLEREQFDKDTRWYSAGQKKKVLLAKSLCEPAHLYLWDEPLNYVDVLSRMQIEELICQYQPTMIFVEHDGAFDEKAATRTIHLPAKCI